MRVSENNAAPYMTQIKVSFELTHDFHCCSDVPVRGRLSLPGAKSSHGDERGKILGGSARTQ